MDPKDRSILPFNQPLSRLASSWMEPSPFLPPASLNQTTHGAADWMNADLAANLGLYGSDGILMAKGQRGIMRYSLGRHSMVVAPSRSGKGVSFVVPNLLHWPGSAFAIDPKGELAHLTAARRRNMGQKVYVLDPCRVSGQPVSRFNPLEWLSRSFSYDTDLKRIIQALTPERGGTAAFWNDAPRALLSGIISYQIAVINERKSLGRTFELLNGSEEEWKDLIEAMKFCNGGSPDLNRLVRERGRWFASLHEEHQQYHRGTLQWHLDWLSVKEARDMVEESDFDIREIKEGRATVYVCIPPIDNETYEGFTRLLATLAIRAMYLWQVPPGSKEPPVLILLDEFATTVGRMSVFDEAYTNIAGYGGRFVTVLQTIDQLQTLYPVGRGTQSWKTVYESAGLRLFFNAEGETARFVSEMLGKKTDFTPSPIGSSNAMSRPLLFPEEVSFPRDNQGRHVPEAVFGFVHGFPPIRATRLVYHRDEEFRGQFNPEPVPKPFRPEGLTWAQEAERDIRAGVGFNGDSLERVREERKQEPPRVREEDLKKYAEMSGWA